MSDTQEGIEGRQEVGMVIDESSGVGELSSRVEPTEECLSLLGGVARSSSMNDSAVTVEGDEDWYDYAKCKGVDPDLFFTKRGASTREAKETCAGCMVSYDCLEFALENREKFGIWGGTSERERRRIRRRRAVAARSTSNQ